MFEKSKQKGGDNMEILKHLYSGKEVATLKWFWKHTGVILGYSNQYRDFIVAHNHPTTGVTIVTLSQFMGSQEYWFTGKQSQFNFEMLVNKYNSQIGKPYNAIFDNCQHFSSGLIDGRETSTAVQGTTLVAGLFLLLYALSNKKESR